MQNEQPMTEGIWGGVCGKLHIGLAVLSGLNMLRSWSNFGAETVADSVVVPFGP